MRIDGRWMVLAAAVWIQAFTGTNFDFSAYSSELKAALGISQVQLSYLATASDLGKALGWSSGLALIYLPLPLVLLLTAVIGLVAYAVQWLVITSRISLPYLPSGDGKALLAGTALVGLSSGFVFAAAVSVTSDLFGPNSVGVNHNILITNIPVGSLLYGVLAALYYDANGVTIGDGMVVCMGRECYAKTFVLWGCISLFGLACSVVLYLRTRLAYEFSDRRRSPADLVDRGAIDNGVDG